MVNPILVSCESHFQIFLHCNRPIKSSFQILRAGLLLVSLITVHKLMLNHNLGSSFGVDIDLKNTCSLEIRWKMAKILLCVGHQSVWSLCWHNPPLLIKQIRYSNQVTSRKYAYNEQSKYPSYTIPDAYISMIHTCDTQMTIISIFNKKQEIKVKDNIFFCFSYFSFVRIFCWIKKIYIRLSLMHFFFLYMSHIRTKKKSSLSSSS
jgi:hypothetical protein